MLQVSVWKPCHLLPNLINDGAHATRVRYRLNVPARRPRVRDARPANRDAIAGYGAAGVLGRTLINPLQVLARHEMRWVNLQRAAVMCNRHVSMSECILRVCKSGHNICGLRDTSGLRQRLYTAIELFALGILQAKLMVNLRHIL